jgi:hypothetical protein
MILANYTKLTNIPTAETGISAPEQHRQKRHEECMGAEIGGKRKERIKHGRAHLVLKPSEVGRLEAHDGQDLLPGPIPPFRKAVLVCAVDV